MPPNFEGSLALTRLGGKYPAILFVIILLAFVAESQLTQYVQSTLHFRQPFFLFYVVHSAFALIFPLHLLFLMLTVPVSVESLLAGLSLAVKVHFSPSNQDLLTTLRSSFPHVRFLKLIALLTLGLTIPSVLWFVSVSLSPLSDITAIWNTNAFFAYLITVRLFKLNLEPRKLLSVLIATFGVIAVVYGDARVSDAALGLDAPTRTRVASNDSVKPKAPLLGDLLTLCASVGYGMYQVMYKRHAAIPSDPEFVPGGEYLPLPDSANHAAVGLSEGCSAELDDVVYPPPFGLHPNLLACGMGLMTLFTLWILLPIAHYSGYERFRLPDSPSVILSIAGVACTGLVFNSGLLILLGIWGPIVVSVGNLLTIVLVLLSDITVGQGLDVITPWNLAGSGAIVVAFGILLHDMIQRHN